METVTTANTGTPVTDLVRALFSRSQTFSTERHEALEQIEKLERENAELRKRLRFFGGDR